MLAKIARESARDIASMRERGRDGQTDRPTERAILTDALGVIRAGGYSFLSPQERWARQEYDAIQKAEKASDACLSVRVRVSVGVGA